MPEPTVPSPLSPPPAGDGAAHWAHEAGRWVLHLQGHWQTASPPAWPEWPASLKHGAEGALIAFDTESLASWGAPLAARLWELQQQLRRQGAQLDDTGLPEGLRDLLRLAQSGRAALPAVSRDGAAPRLFAQALHTLAFFGEVLLALGRWLTGRETLQRRELLRQLDECGPRSLPIVLLTCALIGLMLAYMGGAQLGRIGAPGYVASIVTVGMWRELAGMMTGIILAGRVGAAFAAQLGTMQAHEEVDALRALGVDPIAHLVLPRLLALLLVGPPLMLLGALAGIAAGWPPAVLAYGLTTPEYLQEAIRSTTFTHLWIGLFKGMLYVALVALAGCREGLHAGRNAQAVGQATTAAVVKALVWIVCAAAFTTVLFTSLGY